jgi:CRISPR-associated protein Cas1
MSARGKGSSCALTLSKAGAVDDLRVVEGRVAQHCWLAIQSFVPETFCFQSRIVKSHQYNASDPFNLCLNYSYGVIEGYVRRAVNIVGLEPSVGWLHEFTGAQTRESCVYDLMEPFRWLGDLATIQAFESRALDLKDFYFTGDDYSYKIEIEAKRRFLQLLKDRFNSGVRYKDKTWKWDTFVLNKTQELARFLLDKSKQIDFVEPRAILQRSDTQDLRKRILELTQLEAQKLGVGKSTLHYLRVSATNDRPFKVYQKVAHRLW